MNKVLGSCKVIIKIFDRHLRMSLCLMKNNVTLQGFVDVYFSGDLDDKKSILSYVFALGGTTISWMSRFCKCMSLSTTTTKYITI